MQLMTKPRNAVISINEIYQSIWSGLGVERKGLSYRLQTSLRHIRNRRRACCSASTLAFNSETFGPLATFGALGSSVREADLGDFFAVPSDKTDRAASIKRSKNKDLSSADGSLTW